MAQAEWVLITHPKVDGSARVHRKSVPHWQSAGWDVERVPEKPKAAPVRRVQPQPVAGEENN